MKFYLIYFRIDECLNSPEFFDDFAWQTLLLLVFRIIIGFWAGRHWWIESVTMVRPIDFRKGILFTFWKHQWTEMDLVNYWIDKIFQSVWLRLIPVKNENVLPKI